MKFIIQILPVAILLFSITACSSKQFKLPMLNDEDCRHFPAKDSPEYQKLTTSDFGKAFQIMRKTEKNCYRKWDSDLYRAMDELRMRLGDGKHKIKDLHKYMGKADSILDKRLLKQSPLIRDQVFQKAIPDIRANPDKAYHIYFWRGWHDYVYFITKDKNVVAAEWYMAYE